MEEGTEARPVIKSIPELIKEDLIRQEERQKVLQEVQEKEKTILDHPFFGPALERKKRQMAEVEARVQGLYRELDRVKSSPASERVAALERLEGEAKGAMGFLQTLAGPEYAIGSRRGQERLLRRVHVPIEHRDPPIGDAYKKDLRTLKSELDEELRAYALNLRLCQSLLDQVERQRDQMVAEYEAGLRDGEKEAQRRATLEEIASIETEKYKAGKAIADRRHGKK